jgi:hypothetical protein
MPFLVGDRIELKNNIGTSLVVSAGVGDVELVWTAELRLYRLPECVCMLSVTRPAWWKVLIR